MPWARLLRAAASEAPPSLHDPPCSVAFSPLAGLRTPSASFPDDSPSLPLLRAVLTTFDGDSCVPEACVCHRPTVAEAQRHEATRQVQAKRCYLHPSCPNSTLTQLLCGPAYLLLSSPHSRRYSPDQGKDNGLIPLWGIFVSFYK